MEGYKWKSFSSVWLVLDFSFHLGLRTDAFVSLVSSQTWLLSRCLGRAKKLQALAELCCCVPGRVSPSCLRVTGLAAPFWLAGLGHRPPAARSGHVQREPPGRDPAASRLPAQPAQADGFCRALRMLERGYFGPRGRLNSRRIPALKNACQGPRRWERCGSSVLAAPLPPRRRRAGSTARSPCTGPTRLWALRKHSACFCPSTLSPGHPDAPTGSQPPWHCRRQLLSPQKSLRGGGGRGGGPVSTPSCGPTLATRLPAPSTFPPAGKGHRATGRCPRPAARGRAAPPPCRARRGARSHAGWERAEGRRLPALLPTAAARVCFEARVPPARTFPGNGCCSLQGVVGQPRPQPPRSRLRWPALRACPQLRPPRPRAGSHGGGGGKIRPGPCRRSSSPPRPFPGWGGRTQHVPGSRGQDEPLRRVPAMWETAGVKN